MRARYRAIDYSQRLCRELHWRGFRFVGDARHVRVQTRHNSVSITVGDDTRLDTWLRACEKGALRMIDMGYRPVIGDTVPREIHCIADPDTYIVALLAFEAET